MKNKCKLDDDSNNYESDHDSNTSDEESELIVSRKCVIIEKFANNQKSMQGKCV